MKKQGFIAAALACLMLAGCGSDEGAIKKALVEYYEKDLCMPLGPSIPFTITIDNPLGGAPDKAWVDVLEQAGMVEQTGVSQRGGGALVLKMATYDLTAKGKKLQNGNRLCYGKTKLVKLIEFSKPQTSEGSEGVEAKALLKHEVSQSWAENPVFTGRVRRGEEEVTDILVKTNKGWSVR